MSALDNIRNRLRSHLNKKTGSSKSMSFAAVGTSLPEVPRAVEKRGQDYVSYGEYNLYPNLLSDLKYISPIHNAILSTAADMIAGDGFLINGAKTADESLVKYGTLSTDQKEKYDSFILNENDRMTLHEIRQKLSFDYKEQGACAYEVVYSLDFQSINRIKYVDVKNVRAGKMVDNVVKYYWYSRDWSNPRNPENKPNRIQAADFKDARNPESKTREINQLVYLRRGSMDYYGEPDYTGGLTWIQTDGQMGIFHLSNIENGMNPSLLMKFFQEPATEADKQSILNEIRNRFIGPKRTGKHMVTFSDGKDLAPEIAPIQTSNLDKQLLNLAELCDKKILTGHKLTSPLLAGISVSGQLGGNVELETAYRIYDKTRISPYRNSMDSSFNKILTYNGVGVVVRTNPYDPFSENTKVDLNPINSAINSLSPLVANKVLESMSLDEIRSLVGLGKATPNNTPTVTV